MVKSRRLRIASLHRGLHIDYRAALHTRPAVRTLKLSFTLGANFVRSLLDRKYAAHLTVAATKGKPENPQQGFMRPALVSARYFHWYPANRAGCGRCFGPGQSRNQPLRSKY